MEVIIKSLRPNVTDSKEEIAEGGDVSRPTLYRIWPFLERNGLLQETRKYQNTQLYKINEQNEMVKILVKLEIAAVKEQFKRMESARGIAKGVSSKNIRDENERF